MDGFHRVFNSTTLEETRVSRDDSRPRENLSRNKRGEVKRMVVNEKMYGMALSILIIMLVVCVVALLYADALVRPALILGIIIINSSILLLTKSYSRQSRSRKR